MKKIKITIVIVLLFTLVIFAQSKFSGWFFKNDNSISITKITGGNLEWASNTKFEVYRIADFQTGKVSYFVVSNDGVSMSIATDMKTNSEMNK